MNGLNAIGVFCGARHGGDPAFAESAARTARLLASEGITIVYGGGNVGLMGVVADAALEAGGNVVGVIPRSMVEVELAHTGIQELIVAETMLERKEMITERSDAFICLPGGVGTLDEMFEVLTGNQLKTHDKPVGLLNTSGFYDDLWSFLRRASDLGLILEPTMRQVSMEFEPHELLAALRMPVQI